MKQRDSTTNSWIIDEKRVYRRIALPVSAFDVLQQLKRRWAVATNGETLTRLLLTAGRQIMMTENADDRESRADHHGRP